MPENGCRPALALTIAAFATLNGCCRPAVDPTPSVQAVRQQVYCRSGYLPFADSLDDHGVRDVADLLEGPLTIERAIAIALCNNPSLGILYEELGITQATLAQASLPPNPLCELSYRFATQRSFSDLIDGALLQNLLDIVLRPLKTRSALAERQATVARVAAALLDTIGQVQKAFIAYQLQKQTLQWHEQLLLASDAASELADRLLQAGNISADQALERQLQHRENVIALAAQRLRLQEGRIALQRLMGLPSQCDRWDSVDELPPLPDGCAEGYDAVSAVMSALENSLELEALRYDIAAKAAALGVDQARIVFPEMAVGASAEREEGVWYAGPALAIGLPLFDTGAAHSALAAATLRQLGHRYQALALQVAAQTHLSLCRLHTLSSQYRHYVDAVVPLAARLSAVTLLQYNAMQKGVFALLDAKTAELQRRLAANAALLAWWEAHIDWTILLQGHLRE